MIFLEFPSRQPGGKHDVELFVTAVAGLGHAEEGPDEGQEGGAEPEETRLPGPGPGRGIHHVRLQDVGNDLPEVIRVSGQNDRLRPQARRTDLGRDGPTDRSDGEGEGQEPNDAQRGLCPFDPLHLGVQSETADDE